VKNPIRNYTSIMDSYTFPCIQKGSRSSLYARYDRHVGLVGTLEEDNNNSED